MSKSLLFTLTLEIYPSNIIFSFAQTDDELKKSLTRLKFNYLDYFDRELKYGRCSLFPNGDQIIRLREYPENAAQYGCLQHEIFHCVTNTMDVIGVKLNLGTSDEAFAYLVGYITRKIYERLWK